MSVDTKRQRRKTYEAGFKASPTKQSNRSIAGSTAADWPSSRPRPPPLSQQGAVPHPRQLWHKAKHDVSTQAQPPPAATLEELPDSNKASQPGQSLMHSGALKPQPPAVPRCHASSSRPSIKRAALQLGVPPEVICHTAAYQTDSLPDSLCPAVTGKAVRANDRGSTQAAEAAHSPTLLQFTHTTMHQHLSATLSLLQQNRCAAGTSTLAEPGEPDIISSTIQLAKYRAAAVAVTAIEDVLLADRALELLRAYQDTAGNTGREQQKDALGAVADTLQQLMAKQEQQLQQLCCQCDSCAKQHKLGRQVSLQMQQPLQRQCLQPLPPNHKSFSGPVQHRLCDMLSNEATAAKRLMHLQQGWAQNTCNSSTSQLQVQAKVSGGSAVEHASTCCSGLQAPSPRVLQLLPVQQQEEGRSMSALPLQEIQPGARDPSHNMKLLTSISVMASKQPWTRQQAASW